MSGIQIPDYGTVRPVTLAESMAQWADVASHQKRATLAEMQMQQAQRQQQRDDALRSLYASGQKPTPEQIGQYDPEMAMKAEQHDTVMQGHQQDYDIKKHSALVGMATDAMSKLEQSGITDPQQQQAFITQYQQVHKPYITGVLGLPGDGDMTVEQVKQLAETKPGEYHPPVATTSGYLGYGKSGWELINDKDGNPYLPTAADPTMAAQIQAAKEGQKGVKAHDEEGREFYDTQGNVSGGRIGGFSPNPALPPVIEISPDASPEDRAILEGIAEKTSGQVRSQSPAEETAAKENAKNEAEMSKAKQERLYAVGNLVSLLEKKVDGNNIEDLIKNSTGSGVGSTSDKVASYFGQTTKGATNIAKLKPVSEWLTSLVPRMQGPQSNFDVARYQAMAGDIANPEIPTEQRVASFNALKGMLNDYLKSSGSGGLSTQEAEELEQLRARFGKK